MALTGALKTRSYSLYKLLWSAVDWLYPPFCGGCDAPGSRWCAACHSQLETIDQNHICPRCGNPQRTAGLCRKCQAALPPYTALRSVAVFHGPLRNAIHRLKYERDMGLGDALAIPMIELYQQLGWNVDLLVSVPLHATRIRDRGYNQSNLLGIPLALALNKPFLSQAVRRLRHTPSQVGLNAHERLLNVDGAFWANPHKVKGAAVLVVDDVATTGSTLRSCSQALLSAGAAGVWCLSLARAAPGADQWTPSSSSGSWQHPDQS